MDDNRQADAGTTGSFVPNAGPVLSNVTPADRGLVERPMLTPHIEHRRINDQVALLVSETYSSVLYGQRYLDLLPLLDGTRTRGEIAAALHGRHSLIEVQSLLVNLASKGHVVSAEFSMPHGMAAFWTSFGASPRWAEERLAATPVRVAGDDDGRLAAALSGMGATVRDEDPALVVVRTRDYIDDAHGEANRRHLESGTPWTLVKTDGIWPLFGPVFRPGDEGTPCWACLAHRMRANNEVENFLRNAKDAGGSAAPRALAPAVAGAAASLAGAEIVKWIVLGERSVLHTKAISIETAGLESAHHPVMRRPQCTSCGDEALFRPDRAPVPVALKSSPKPIHNSGGLRSVPPEETVRRYRHIVSPVSGVVTQLMRTTDAADPWLHVYWAGSNLALMSENLFVLRNSLRTKSSGKGSTPEQAEASALCEAVERYSGVFHGDEIRRRARFRDFADGEALHPNTIMHYSERQFENADEYNALGLRFNRIPERFDPEAEMDWSPVWSVTHQRFRYLPTSMLYFSKPLEGPKIYTPPDSNGCAAGNTLEEAILQGFFELTERDGFACWWYNRLSLPEVDLDSFGDAYLTSAKEYYAAHNREIWVLDATNDIGIPVFISVSRRTDKEAEDILYSAGSHMDPHIAAMRAVCELNQYLSAVRDAKDDGSGYLVDDPESLWWWKNIKLADQPYLGPDTGAPKRVKSDYPVPATKDLLDDVEHCRAVVEGKGMEFLVLDQTRADIGMPVARTIVPGLRHFWTRFAPGRLYDVPVGMGLLDKPTDEADLNPIAVFI